MENKSLGPKLLPAYKRRFSQEGARALLISRASRCLFVSFKGSQD